MDSHCHSQLPRTVQWAGSVNGSIKVRYDNDIKVLAETINNSDSVNFGYDKDGLLTSGGVLKLRLNTLNILAPVSSEQFLGLISCCSSD